MANFYGTGRSNFFRVKDLEKFKEWLEETGCSMLCTDEYEGKTYVCIQGDDESGSFPVEYWIAETDEDVDFYAKLAEHLEEDSITILLESGAEKLRYVSGIAHAINSEGEVKWVSIDQIYADALEFMDGEVTRAEYDKVDVVSLTEGAIRDVDTKKSIIKEMEGLIDADLVGDADKLFRLKQLVSKLKEAV